ncbi:hypothetical protein [Sorangium sp. So ce542]|uniref:hypothetical protein n=1 Tax=Sorangium sp. So ce542 TaxID=3133316 RepID=UPI003F62FDB8
MTDESADRGAEKAAFFRPENEEEGSREESSSPAGRYRLVVSSYSTGHGTWDYTQGEVYRTGAADPIAVVQRNFGSFPFLFVEAHPNGHDYLVCGEDYQGQTVVELDTGKRRDHLPEEAREGVGFCWVDMRFEPSVAMLVVEGCVWACPYELRFFDFADPMSGWPEIEAPVMIDADRRPLTVDAGGTIVCYRSAPDGAAGGGAAEASIAAILTFRRDGLKLVLESEWISEEERARRTALEERRKR